MALRAALALGLLAAAQPGPAPRQRREAEVRAGAGAGAGGLGRRGCRGLYCARPGGECAPVWLCYRDACAIGVCV